MILSNLSWLLSYLAESDGGSDIRLSLSPLWELLKILVPASGVWIAAHYANRKDQRESELRQQDKLNTSWSDMTAQSREIMTELQKEISRLQDECSSLRAECERLRKESGIRKKNTKTNPRGSSS